MKLTRIAGLGLAATLALTAVGCSSPGSGGGGAGDVPTSITMVESGGTSGESIKEAYGVPFTKATGVKLVQETPTDLGKLEAMVKSVNVTADLLELGGASVQLAIERDLIEKLDWDDINPDPMNPESKLEYAFGYQTFALYMGARDDAKPVTTWAEFFDTDRQPGKRAIPAYSTYALPIALLADGVKPEDLYPLDVDRALAFLETVADDLLLWEAASQTPQMLESNEAVYAATWDNVRVADGFQVSYDNAVREMSFFVIPKGAKHVKQANQLLHEMSKVENQAVSAELLPIAGPSPDLMSKLSPEIVAEMPAAPEFADTQATYDYQWWADNAAEVGERWAAFKLEKLG